MDSSDNHRSKLPVAVTLASEAEPVTCDGYLIETDGGFILEFCAGENSYSVIHNGSSTRLVSTGLLSYDMEFAGGGDTCVSAPFGNVDFKLIPLRRDIGRDGDTLRIGLEYKLVGCDAEISRAVDVTARIVR